MKINNSTDISASNDDPTWQSVLHDWQARFDVFKASKPLSLKTRVEMRCAGLLDSAVQMQAISEHCSESAYLLNLARGGSRYHYDGREASKKIRPIESHCAIHILFGLEKRQNQKNKF